MAQPEDRAGALVGALVLITVGGVCLFLGLPDDGPVTCHGEPMGSDDFCGPVAGRVVTGTGAPPPGNYSSVAEQQHAATPAAVWLGVVLLLLGLGALVSALKAYADRPPGPGS
ncbi:hypothetical protein AB0D08_40365 [Kitasatospora sp. NPDC048540]|uniref:hypothetical protein n=1 Tax=Kitasatospora sp. NPDC048540 TaxID=3155634 RepID=UPI0033F03CC5